MDKNVVNFSSFFGKETKSKLGEFKREDFEDLLPPDRRTNKIKESSNSETVEVDTAFDPPVDSEDFVIEGGSPEELDLEESIPSIDNKNNFNKIKEDAGDYYVVYKDKFENFSCNVFVEGAKIHNTKARLVLESDDWNLVFEGDIDEYGKCTIPMKKLNILDEGTVGKIRLEVIAENTIFTPWEDDFKVKLDKKVAVEVPKKNVQKETSVKVKVGKR
jgi:hypothetical protein